MRHEKPFHRNMFISYLWDLLSVELLLRLLRHKRIPKHSWRPHGLFIAPFILFRVYVEFTEIPSLAQKLWKNARRDEWVFGYWTVGHLMVSVCKVPRIDDAAFLRESGHNFEGTWALKSLSTPPDALATLKREILPLLTFTCACPSALLLLACSIRSAQILFVQHTRTHSRPFWQYTLAVLKRISNGAWKSVTKVSWRPWPFYSEFQIEQEFTYHWFLRIMKCAAVIDFQDLLFGGGITV